MRIAFIIIALFFVAGISSQSMASSGYYPGSGYGSNYGHPAGCGCCGGNNYRPYRPGNYQPYRPGYRPYRPYRPSGYRPYNPYNPYRPYNPYDPYRRYR